MVVADVIGYSAKKLQPAASAPHPMASLPSMSASFIVDLFARDEISSNPKLKK